MLNVHLFASTDSEKFTVLQRVARLRKIQSLHYFKLIMSGKKYYNKINETEQIKTDPLNLNLTWYDVVIWA